MAQIKETDKRFRTKQQIIDDIAFILRAPVTIGTKVAVIDNALWVWTEFDGKHEGCRLWTEAAVLRYAENRRQKLKRYHYLRHEHVVPKSVIRKMLLTDKPPSTAKVRRIFETFLIGVVVERDEDLRLNEYRSRMPDDFDDPGSKDHKDPWLRYKRCGITILKEPPLRDDFRDLEAYLARLKKRKRQ